MNEMYTKTGIMVSSSDINRYPRPALVRNSFFSLNGKWNIKILDQAHKIRREGTILVPFSIESALGGFKDQLLPKETAIYTKEFSLPKSFSKAKVILHFEAVDYETKVKLNGEDIFVHRGGYTPFEIDIASYLKATNTLEVIVTDPTDNGRQERGKQTLKSHGMWYNPTSGIYGSVWLEALNPNYVIDYNVTANVHEQKVFFHLVNSVEKFHYTLTVYENNTPIIVKEIDEPLTEINLADGHPWSPEDPFIYTFRLYNDSDDITGYFGFRDISIGPGHRGKPVMHLNGQPYFINGLLDQGYWPESGLTPPSQMALKQDILLAKKFGFNAIRKHIKIEDNYFYYYCDLLGILVIQDMPSGGDYHFSMMTIAPSLGFTHRKDTKYRAFGRKDASNREEFIDMVRTNVGRLQKHPSIVIWTIFNEGWGQFDSVKLTNFVKSLDPTRLIDSASGWFDQKTGDFNSVHRYFRKLKTANKKDSRAYFISEFGGYSLALDFHRFNEEKEYGYRKFKTTIELENAFIQLYREEVMPLFLSGLAGVIYTQLCDVEEETNGLITYDRKIEKMHADKIYSILSKIHY